MVRQAVCMQALFQTGMTQLPVLVMSACEDKHNIALCPFAKYCSVRDYGGSLLFASLE